MLTSAFYVDFVDPDLVALLAWRRTHVRLQVQVGATLKKIYMDISIVYPLYKLMNSWTNHDQHLVIGHVKVFHHNVEPMREVLCQRGVVREAQLHLQL